MARSPWDQALASSGRGRAGESARPTSSIKDKPMNRTITIARFAKRPRQRSRILNLARARWPLKSHSIGTDVQIAASADAGLSWNIAILSASATGHDLRRHRFAGGLGSCWSITPLP
jgi:hypothetical protein